MVEQGGFLDEGSLDETARTVTEPATDLPTGPVLDRDFLVLAISSLLSCGWVGRLGGVPAARLPRAEILDVPKPAWIHRAGLLPGTVLALGNVAFAAFAVFIPLYAREVGLTSVGIVFTVASFSIAATRILLRRLPDRWGPGRSRLW